MMIATAAVQGPLNTVTLGTLLSVTVTVLMAVVYALIRGKLRPESVVREIREDRDARIAEARSDRDTRLEEAAKLIEMYRTAWEQEQRRAEAQEIQLNKSLQEIGDQVSYVISSLHDARHLAQQRGGTSKERAQNA